MLLVLTTVAAGCRTGRNYPGPDGPWYAGGPPVAQVESTGVDTLDVVAFNIKLAARPDRALALIRSEPELARADVLLLNEMDESGTRLIADSLGMFHVYYPAVLHRTGRHFGNAILSRWPIIEHERLRLPHTARFQRTRRTSTAATIRVGTADVRVHSTHLGTLLEIGPGARRDQLRTVLRDAEQYDHAIVGGDLNDADVGRIAEAHGFAWPTRYGPRTMFFGRFDHILVRGLAVPDSGAAGTVLDARGASDHRPVWTRAILRSR